MPITVRGAKSDLKMADLLTPNRLLLGHNNDQKEF